MTLLDAGIDALVLGGAVGNAARLALFLRVMSGERLATRDDLPVFFGAERRSRARDASPATLA